MELPERITRDQLNAAIRALGIDPTQVTSVTLTPDQVTVTATVTVTIDSGTGFRPSRTTTRDTIPVHT